MNSRDMRWSEKGSSRVSPGSGQLSRSYQRAGLFSCNSCLNCKKNNPSPESSSPVDQVDISVNTALVCLEGSASVTGPASPEKVQNESSALKDSLANNDEKPCDTTSALTTTCEKTRISGDGLKAFQIEIDDKYTNVSRTETTGTQKSAQTAESTAQAEPEKIRRTTEVRQGDATIRHKSVDPTIKSDIRSKVFREDELVAQPKRHEIVFGAVYQPNPLDPSATTDCLAERAGTISKLELSSDSSTKAEQPKETGDEPHVQNSLPVHCQCPLRLSKATQTDFGMVDASTQTENKSRTEELFDEILTLIKQFFKKYSYSPTSLTREAADLLSRIMSLVQIFATEADETAISAENFSENSMEARLLWSLLRIRQCFKDTDVESGQISGQAVSQEVRQEEQFVNKALSYLHIRVPDKPAEEVIVSEQLQTDVYFLGDLFQDNVNSYAENVTSSAENVSSGTEKVANCREYVLSCGDKGMMVDNKNNKSSTVFKLRKVKTWPNQYWKDSEKFEPNSEKNISEFFTTSATNDENNVENSFSKLKGQSNVNTRALLSSSLPDMKDINSPDDIATALRYNNMQRKWEKPLINKPTNNNNKSPNIPDNTTGEKTDTNRNNCDNTCFSGVSFYQDEDGFDVPIVEVPTIAQADIEWLHSSDSLQTLKSSETFAVIEPAKYKRADGVTVDVAIKICTTSINLRQFQREAKIQQYLKDEGVLPRFWGQIIVKKGNEEVIYLVSEIFEPAVTLEDLITRDDCSVLQNGWASICVQLAQCLHKIHQKCVIVNNLSAANIWIKTTARETPVLKFNDLSFATVFNGVVFDYSKKELKSVKHIAPEVKNRQPTSMLSDLWGLGVIYLDVAEKISQSELKCVAETILKEDPKGRENLQGIISALLAITGNQEL